MHVCETLKQHHATVTQSWKVWVCTFTCVNLCIESDVSVDQCILILIGFVTSLCVQLCRPVDPLCMSDRRKTSEELFRRPPVSLLRVPVCEDETLEGDTESEMGDGEEEATSVGAPAHDASSTATTGSNLLYLSDQVNDCV